MTAEKKPVSVGDAILKFKALAWKKREAEGKVMELMQHPKATAEQLVAANKAAVNVERLMREEHLPPFKAALKAMEEVSGAVVAIVLVLCAVFVPVAFLGGIAGQLYRQFAVTVAISVESPTDSVDEPPRWIRNSWILPATRIAIPHASARRISLRVLTRVEAYEDPGPATPGSIAELAVEVPLGL